eukprot:5887598-Prymnesium_polylepis.1
MCYTNVRVVGVRFGSGPNAGMTLALSFEVRAHKKELEIMFGNLLCLTTDGTFRDPIWAVAANYDAGVKGKRTPTLFARLCTESNRQDDLSALLALMNCKSFMVESPTCATFPAPTRIVCHYHLQIPAIRLRHSRRYSSLQVLQRFCARAEGA